MLINVKIISKQLISPNLGKHIHSRNFLAAPNPNSHVLPIPPPGGASVQPR